MLAFPMTLSDPNLDFKVTTLFNANQQCDGKLLAILWNISTKPRTVAELVCCKNVAGLSSLINAIYHTPGRFVFVFREPHYSG